MISNAVSTSISKEGKGKQTKTMAEESQGKPTIYSKIIQGGEAISLLREDWDDLFTRATDAPPYLSHAWANTFIREGRLRGTPLFMLVWSGEKLIALFALSLRRFLWMQIAEPVATAESAYYGVLLDPKYPVAVEYIAKAFRQKKVADLLCIADLWSQDKASNALLAELQRNKLLCLRTHRNPCYRINLRCSYDEYLRKTKSSKRRRELKRNEKKVFELGTVDFEAYVGNQITPEIVTRMAHIQEESWMKRRDAAVLGQSFYRKLLLEMSRAGFGRAWLVKINGSDVCFGFGYVAHERFYYEWTGFKLSYESSSSVGKVLTSWLVRDGCSKGFLSFDFGHGDAEYKRFWSNEHHSVYRVVVGQGIMGRSIAICYYVVWRLSGIKWLRRIYHRLKKLLKG